MAINATRGLPSFSEMYGAFKNRLSLGEALQSGIEGVKSGVTIAREGKELQSQSDLRSAQAEEARARAKSLASGGDRVPLAALPPEIHASLQPFVDAAGTVPKSAATVALGTTEQGRKQDALTRELKLREEMLGEKERGAKERETLQAELNRIREESGAAGRELSAARGVADVTSKVASPSLVGRGVSAVKEAFGGDPLASVLAERQRTAATKKLSELGGVAPVSSTPVAPQPVAAPQPVPATPTPSGPVTVNTQEEYNALPIGTAYIDSTGQTKVKGR